MISNPKPATMMKPKRTRLRQAGTLVPMLKAALTFPPIFVDKPRWVPYAYLACYR